ncbi:MAG: precorrin-3B C(17)-methyltransferase [Clostridiales bacterium]|nr:precorrin-3B C(17)-methyltransferase [Clostridiales bacterium]
MSKLYVVGFGPGDYEHMTHKACEAIMAADVVMGYTAYIQMLEEIFPEKYYLSTPMRKEQERCEMALKEAASGKNVAMVSSGDSGIYGMAGIILQLAKKECYDVDIEVIPGVTAASAAAAVLGAPLMHDFAVISLSDLMTPLEKIMKRVECAAMADFVICLYNPKSRKRTEYIKMAAEIVAKYQGEALCAGIVRNAGRPSQTHTLTTVGELSRAEIDMFSIVIIGNSQTYIEDGKMITPRGYEYK